MANDGAIVFAGSEVGVQEKTGWSNREARRELLLTSITKERECLGLPQDHPFFRTTTAKSKAASNSVQAHLDIEPVD
eukprot:gene43918-45543_t